MSKQPSNHFDEQIPTYEESMSNTSHSGFPAEKTTSNKSPLRQRLSHQRAQRIQNLITSYIEPQIAYIDIDSVSDRTLILFPSDSLSRSSTSQPFTRANIVTPATPPGEVEIIHLKGEENKSAFWAQATAIQELSTALSLYLAEISDQPAAPAPEILSSQPQQIPEQRPPLPARPSKKSWMARKFGLSDPEPDLDPTGSTGKWNLGWRKEQDEVSSGHDAAHVGMHATTRLREVAFRTESEMGLMETSTVRCIWIEIRVNLEPGV